MYLLGFYPLSHCASQCKLTKLKQSCNQGNCFLSIKRDNLLYLDLICDWILLLEITFKELLYNWGIYIYIITAEVPETKTEGKLHRKNIDIWEQDIVLNQGNISSCLYLGKSGFKSKKLQICLYNFFFFLELSIKVNDREINSHSSISGSQISHLSSLE